MIYVDDRVGSKDLLPLFPKNSAKLTHLEYADVAFQGRGVDDLPISIGIERKRMNDMLTSMTTGRLSGHQIPGLIACYDIVYLVVEGLWRANPTDGIMEAPGRNGWRAVQLGTRQFMAKEVWSYLNTLQIMAGIYVWKTGSARATAQWITNLYHWFTNKPIDAHKSHTAQHVQYAALSTKQPPLVQRVAAQLPGVGFSKSKAIAARFGSLIEMIMARDTDWQSIDGIGKKLTNRILEELHK